MSGLADQTIAAIATGAGGGIGIVRISGPDAVAVGARVFRGRGGRSLETSPPLGLVLGAIVDPATGDRIDEAFAVWMREGSSYTGEPTVELQCHGGRGVLDAVLGATLGAGARPATAWEFTKRAFLSGRLDLSQAEAVAELVGARTERARRAALSRLGGALQERVGGLKNRVLDQIAAAEAILDHGAESEGAEPDGPAIAVLAQELRGLIAMGEDEERRHLGLRVVIAGKTNSGKSSIFNVLCNTDRSIVSPVPGTTRDYVEEHSAIAGTLVTLVDTAGLRGTQDPVESEGMRRSQRQMLEADLLILVVDGSKPADADDQRLLDQCRGQSPVIVASKSDLPRALDDAALRERYPELLVLSLSTADGSGCPELIRAIADRCQEDESGGETAAPNPRQREALRSAAESLEAAAELFSLPGALFDQGAMELRRGLAALGEITGETAGEEIVDRIFSRFCLGK